MLHHLRICVSAHASSKVPLCTTQELQLVPRCVWPLLTRSALPRAILSEQFRGGGGGTNGEAMVFGQMLHTVFQKVITATTQGLKVTKAGIQDEIKKVVSCLEHLEQL